MIINFCLKSIVRCIFNLKHRGRIVLGHDTNLKASNFAVSGGTVKIGDSVVVRTGTIFTVEHGSIEIEHGVFFNRNCIIACHDHVYIGKDSIFGPNVCIYDHNHKFSKDCGVKKNEFNCAGVSIGKKCWVGANVVILKGTQLGNGCVVAAGTILCGSYPDNTLIKSKNEIISEKIY